MTAFELCGGEGRGVKQDSTWKCVFPQEISGSFMVLK
jgi:hypothetical protein